MNIIRIEFKGINNKKSLKYVLFVVTFTKKRVIINNNYGFLTIRVCQR